MIAVLWVQDEVSAAAVARMVDMSLEEVADLLGGALGILTPPCWLERQPKFCFS